MQTVQFLVEKKINTNIKNQNNRTAFEEAIELEKAELAVFYSLVGPLLSLMLAAPFCAPI